MDDKVWVVSYCDNSDTEIIITVFNNKEAAESCYATFRTKYHKCSIDECYLYSRFYDGVKWTPELEQLKER